MSLLDKLRLAIGAEHVLTETADIAPYLTDWRDRYHGAAQAVVRPANTAEVAAVVRLAREAGAAIVPLGGNTGLVGGGTADASGTAVVLNTQRLRRVRELDAANDTITVEAGLTLHEVQQAALAAGRLFALSLAAEGSATIGGNLAANAGGTQVLRYGNARDLCLGLEVVLASGEVWDGLRALRKDNTGYDLKQLFIGSEGTLGVITAAVLKLHPLPAARLTAFAALPDLPAANALLARARGLCGASLTAFEVMGASCLQHLAQLMPQVRLPLPLAAPWFALLEISDSESEAHGIARLESVLETALAAGEVSDAVVAQSLAEAAALWQVRESIPEAHARSGGNVKHDISLPVSAIPEFVASTNARLAERFEWIWPSVFGHLGDGNLHYNMGTRPGVPVATAFAHEPEIRRLVHDAVAARGGSISAEHGIGQLKREELALYKSPVELALMRAIKHALDPQGLMNPGKLLP
ncbi:MAG TPA: FAD-binding oxidoreductase [Burkholderiaceae bacterium]|nr:FAD-binding oxidoreductase [Burkholderiaceae bacterium]